MENPGNRSRNNLGGSNRKLIAISKFKKEDPEVDKKETVFLVYRCEIVKSKEKTLERNIVVLFNRWKSLPLLSKVLFWLGVYSKERQKRC